MENSANHGYEGQNSLFGDSHVKFRTDPFVGITNDNDYAMVQGGVNAPPTLGNSDGDDARDSVVAQVDDVLMPVSGNMGVSLSGKWLDLYGRGTGISRGEDPVVLGVFLALILLSAIGLSWALLRRKAGDTPAGESVSRD